MPDTEKLLTDILKIGVKREEQSYFFYISLAKLARDPQSKALFEKLAQEEQNHKESLQLEILKSGRVLKENIANFDEDFDSDIYQNFDDSMDLREGLLMAIGKEKGAFHFYTELAMVFAEKEARQLCLELAQQESRHQILLEIEFSKLQEG